MNIYCTPLHYEFIYSQSEHMMINNNNDNIYIAKLLIIKIYKALDIINTGRYHINTIFTAH